MSQPKQTLEVLATIARCPGLTASGIAKELGLDRHTVYRATRWLEAHGDIDRSDDWPAGFSPRTDAEDEIEAFVDAVDGLLAVEELLDEAMRQPQWSETPRPVQQKIEHAKVQIMRARGEVG